LEEAKQPTLVDVQEEKAIATINAISRAKNIFLIFIYFNKKMTLGISFAFRKIG
jgi:hypothetical protein